MDSPFEGLSSGKASARRKEQRELLLRIADLANEKQVDAVLLCGDLLDGNNSYYETGEGLVKALLRINAPVFISPGNHDFYSKHSPYAKFAFPKNVHIFTKNEIEHVNFDEKGFRIYGCAFTDNTMRDPLNGYCAEKKFGILNIACLHGEPGDFSLANSGMDYVALGHIHKPSGLLKAGNTYYSQCGCPEGRGFDECGDRYVNIVEINAESCSLEQVMIAQRKYESIKVDVSDIEPLLAVKMSLPDDTVKDIYRIILTGDTNSAIDVSRLESLLGEYFFSLEIRNETRIRKDIWDKCAEDSLRGIFLSKMRKLYDEAREDDEKSRIEQSVRWGLAALDNMEEVSVHDN